MKSKFLLFFMMAPLMAALAQEAEAEKSYWSHNGLTGINASQSSFSNWSAGGENSISGNVYFNGSLQYKKDKVSWTNDLNANFGLFYTEANAWRKNMDNLNFASKYGREMTKSLYYAALVDFKTQFANGYNYSGETKDQVSAFMTPAYINLSIGLDYKPDEHLSVYYSPVSGKMTIVNDTLFSSRYGVESGKHVRTEFGSNLKASVDYEFFQKKITLKSTVDLFTAYNASFGNIDVNWDLLLGFNVSKLLTLTFQSTLKYDDDIKTVDKEGNPHGAKIQFKEIVGLGISYKF